MKFVSLKRNKHKRKSNKTKKHKKNKSPKKHNTKYYVFGYGSLINEKSRQMTIKRKSETIPVILSRDARFKRNWICVKSHTPRIKEKSSHICYSNLKHSTMTNTDVNGVLFKVNKEELKLLDKRESAYERIELNKSHIIPFFENNKLPIFKDNCKVVTYVSNVGNSGKGVIFQSYIDTILSGCLNINRKFAEMFVSYTTEWCDILNDRYDIIYQRHNKSSKTNILNINNIMLKKYKLYHQIIDDILLLNYHKHDV